MSCILRLFGFKPPQAPSKKYSVSLSIEDPLPCSDFELAILEEALVKRLAGIKRRSFVAQKNAEYSYEKGEMRKYLHYVNEKNKCTEDIKQVSAHLMKVIETRNDITNPPPLTLPSTKGTKIENSVVNPIQHTKNVTNRSAPQVVSALSVNRTRSVVTNTLPSQASDLSSRS